jgi:transcription elongation GreA/GreB family factor
VATKTEITKLKKQKEELDQVLAADQWTSWREATQTEMDKQVLEKHLMTVENEVQASTRISFKLKSATGVTVKYTVTDGSPDPSNHVISINSPIGQKLTQMKAGDKLEIGGEEFVLSGD